ncbi:hypothetical protein J7E62_15535 [Variovorax paradoxus]|nr:hypothetical protein [Variovorax paradoxus]
MAREDKDARGLDVFVAREDERQAFASDTVKQREGHCRSAHAKQAAVEHRCRIKLDT